MDDDDDDASPEISQAWLQQWRAEREQWLAVYRGWSGLDLTTDDEHEHAMAAAELWHVVSPGSQRED